MTTTTTTDLVTEVDLAEVAELAAAVATAVAALEAAAARLAEIADPLAAAVLAGDVEAHRVAGAFCEAAAGAPGYAELVPASVSIADAVADGEHVPDDPIVAARFAEAAYAFELRTIDAHERMIAELVEEGRWTASEAALRRSELADERAEVAVRRDESIARGTAAVTS